MSNLSYPARFNRLGCARRITVALALAVNWTSPKLPAQQPFPPPEPRPVEIETCPGAPRLQPPCAVQDPYVYGASIDDPVPTGAGQIPYYKPALPHPPKTVHLWELIDDALRLNPATRQAWEMANVSAANYLAAKGANYPTIMLGEAVKPSYSRAPRRPAITHSFELDNALTASLTFLVFDFGGRKATIEAARFTLLASDFATDQAIQTVVAQVLKAYYTVAFEEELVRIYQGSDDFANKDLYDGVKKTSDSADVFQNKVTAIGKEIEALRTGKEAQPSPTFNALLSQRLGPSVTANPAQKADLLANFQAESAVAADYNVQVSKSNLQQINVLKAQIQTSLDQARSDLTAAKVALAASVGLRADTNVNIAKPPADPPVANLDGELQSLIALALQRRPDLANAYHTALAAAETARAAHSNIWPSFNLTVMGGSTDANTVAYSDQNKGDTHSHIVARTDSVSAMLGVTFTAFDGFILHNKARSADFAAAASAAMLANAELGAMADVATSYNAYRWGEKLYQDATNLRDATEQGQKTATLVLTLTPKRLNAFSATGAGGGDASNASVTAIMAHRDNDAAAVNLAMARLNLYLYSYQLALSTGSLLPAINRGEVPSVRSIPLTNGSRLAEQK